MELLHEVAGRDGAALPAHRSGIQSSPEFSHRRASRFPWAWGSPPLCSASVAVANLFSKQIATKYGVAFTMVFFVIFTISERINLRAQAAGEKGARAVQPGSSVADFHQPARAPRLRPGGGARLPSHGAPEARARKNQPAAPRHRGDDRAPHLHRRRRIRSLRRSRFSAITKRSCSATSWRWPKRKASRWSCWWCRR